MNGLLELIGRSNLLFKKDIAIYETELKTIIKGSTTYLMKTCFNNDFKFWYRSKAP